MTTVRCVWPWSIVLVFALAAGVGAAAADDQPAPWVLSPANTVLLEGGGFAGGELQHYLLKYYVGPDAAARFPLDGKVDRATSPQFPLLRDGPKVQLPAGKTVVALGETRFLSADDRKRLAEHPGAILLRRQGDVLIVAGDALEATSEFLDRVAGIRFYAPDVVWTSRPAKPEATVQSLDLFRPRAFATAWLAPYWQRNRQWVRMNPGTGRLGVTSNHNLANVVPPEKYGKAHPEIYEMRGGDRRVPLSVGTKIWNPCLSAKALPELAMAYVREQMKARPATKYISIGMMDISFDCECEACQASVQATGSYSTLYYTFLNDVARQCQAEYPGLLITSLLYVNARTPPVGIRIEPNVVVKVVTKTYRFVSPPALEEEKQRIRAFSDLGARWMIHDWCFSGVSPRSYMRQYGAFLQWAQQHHMIGAYVEYSPGENWYLDGAKYWILGRLLVDPYQDVDLLWKRYCDDMFGAAGETMFQFYQHFQDRFVYAGEHIDLADLPRQEPALYSEQDVALERSLLERTIAATKGEPLVQERLAKVMRYFRAHELFALATHTPHQLEWEFRGKAGINRDLLAFYVNDDGTRIERAIAYYKTERTIAPDDNYMDVRLGMPPSYVNNYTRGFASLLRAIRAGAVGAIDVDGLDRPGVEKMVARSRELLRENLPAKSLPGQVELFEKILGKVLWVPTAEKAPKIDGDLFDPEWAGAAELADFTEQDTLRVPAHGTGGKVVRVGDNLVIGMECRQVGEIWAQSPADTLTGTHIWRESGLEVLFGPVAKDQEKPPFAQYVINAFGAFRGFNEAKDNRAGVTVAVKLNREKGLYVVEAILPLKGPGYDYTKQKVLTFNVGRMVYTRDSYAADVTLGWYPIFMTASDPASRGLIVFQ